MGIGDKTLLVTGGTGFIGAAIVNKLVEKDYFVNVISHPDDSNWRIEDLSNCKVFKADLLRPGNVENLINKIQPDIIFHLAGIITPKRDNLTINKVYSINLGITKNIILALNKFDYELFIHTGSGNEYGDISSPLQENARENPNSPYGASKVAATYFCDMMAKSFEKPIITIRPFLIYGPKQILGALIPSLLYAAIEKKSIRLSPCEQTRDFIFIDDVADAYISMANNSLKIHSGGIFNLGSGKETQLLKIINLIKNHFEDSQFLIGEIPYRPGETMKKFCSIEKIIDNIGWTPIWSIEDGINSTIDWWENNRNIWINFKHMWEN